MLLKVGIRTMFYGKHVHDNFYHDAIQYGCQEAILFANYYDIKQNLILRTIWLFKNITSLESNTFSFPISNKVKMCQNFTKIQEFWFIDFGWHWVSTHKGVHLCCITAQKLLSSERESWTTQNRWPCGAMSFTRTCIRHTNIQTCNHTKMSLEVWCSLIFLLHNECWSFAAVP